MKMDDKLLKSSLTAAIDLSVWKIENKKEKVRKFDETVDFIANLKDLNLNDPKQRIDLEYLLPNDTITKKLPNVCVIATEDILVEAKKMGLDTLNLDELGALDRQEKKSKKKFVKKYEFFIVEGKIMSQFARYLARFAGPLGKMPKPFPNGYGIVNSIEDLKTAIERHKKVIRIQIKKQPIIQVKIGKKSMDYNKIFENLKAFVEFLAEQLPHKYNNLKSAYVKTTMGKAIKIDQDFLKNLKVK